MNRAFMSGNSSTFLPEDYVRRKDEAKWNIISLLLFGVVMVAVVFSYPGLGRLMVDSVVFRDVPQLLVVAMVFCAFYVALNILADIGAIMANPRLRYAK